MKADSQFCTSERGGRAGMSDAEGLLGRIAALRQRLEHAQGILRDATEHFAAPATTDLVDQLHREVTAGAQTQALLDGSMRAIAAMPEGVDVIRPERLIGRARQLLERGRAMILHLRRLTADVPDGDDPLAFGVRQISSMVEASIRFVQAFPNAPSCQMRLCDGLEGFHSAIAERIDAVTAAADRRRIDRERLEAMGHWLTALHEGRAIAPEPLVKLASEIVDEARLGTPLRFLTAGSPAGADWLLRHVAAHSLTVAYVIARIARDEADALVNADSLVLAALVHDVGLLGVPVEILAQPSPLSDGQKRVVERHPYSGAERTASSLGDVTGLADAVANHHERLDGGGYPAGLVGAAIPAPARWLAVADVYAAIACQRPHRGPADPRTALTDTLMMAEHGSLDRVAAERLLNLTFYPVGTVVELTNGSVGRVVAVHPPRADVHAPARPIVAVLTDERGAFLPRPETLDLALCEGWAVVRALPVAQRRRLLTPRYPEWAA